MSKRYGRARREYTSLALEDLRRATLGGFDPKSRGVIEAASKPAPKKLAQTHEEVLRKVGAGIYLGPWATALLYGNEISRWKKPEHKALVQLVKRGDLKVIRVSGDDLAPWLPPQAPYSSPPQFGYVVAPAGSMIAQGAEVEQ